MSKSSVTNNLPIGSYAWIPANSTQLLYKIPSELKLNNCKLYWLPVIVRDYDNDGKTGSYSLDWEKKVIIKCSSELSLSRSPTENLFNSNDANDLSKLEMTNDATIGWEFLLKFNQGSCVFTIGPSPTIIMINPLKSFINKDGYINDISIMISKINRKSSSKVNTNNDLYSFLNSVHLNLDKTSQAILFKGISGSGKTENMKKSIQYFILKSSNLPLPNLPTTRMSEYETIGSIGNSFIIPHDIECSKAIFTASKVMDLFGNAATGVNTTSSRHLKNIKLHYNNDYKKIIGATIELSLIDSLRICNHDIIQRPYYIFILLAASLTPKQINQDYNLNPSLIGLIIGDLYLDKSQLADEFQQFKDELIELGMSNEILDEIITCLIGFLSFFNIDIEGDDSVILSEKSVNSIRNIEKIFHLESQSLEKYLLYRIDDKLGGGKGTVTFDNRPIDAKAILNAFCSDIYQKIIKYLLDFCSEKSLNGIFIDTTEYDTDTPDSQRSNTLNLIDITGYELLNQYDNTLNNGFSQFAINYVQEKLSTYYITSSINKYIKSYADDKIALQLPPSLSNLTQDSNLYSDLFDRPSLGMVNQLEDVCNAVRGDDRVFTDKVLTVHSRSKLVRSAGHKSITNSFIVKHSFNDSVPYDTTGFIAYNKARVNIQGQQLLAMMPFHILRTSIDGSNTIVESDPRESPIIYDAASRRSAISDATSMRSSIGSSKIRQSSLLLTKTKDLLTKLINTLDKITKNYVLCIRPYLSIASGSQSLDPEYCHPQIKSLYLTSMSNLMKSGYSYKQSYFNFYSYFREMLPLNHLLPVQLPYVAEDTINQDKCKELFNICLKLLDLSYSDFEKLELNSVYFAPACICIKNKLSTVLIEGRNKMVDKLLTKTILIQKFIRKYVYSRKYKRILKFIVKIQSIIRYFVKKSKYHKYLRGIKIIKRSYLMSKYLKLFKKQKKAINIIKQRYCKQMIIQIRYKKFIKFIRKLQLIVRNFIKRNKILKLFNIIEKLRNFLLLYVKRCRIHKKREISSIKLQKHLRGWISRSINQRMVYILLIRKKQRLAHRVTIKLQAYFRKRLIVKKFRKLLINTKKLQQWIRSYIQRKNYLSIKKLALFLQKYWRRLKAKKQINLFKNNKLQYVENEKYNKYLQNEIANYLTKFNSSSDCNAFQLGKRFYRNGRINATRRMIGYIVNSNLSNVYQESWYIIICKFLQNLKKSSKKSIIHIATGKEHTVIVDDCANIYSFGKNDYGQLGHNNRIPLNDPKLLETIDLSLQIPLKDLANTVVDVCCGQGHTLLLTKSGRIYSWGDNRRGQLGHSHFESCAIPRLVGHDPSNTPASTAVQIKGTLVMPNRGTGSSSGTRAKDLIIKNVKQIGCGLFHSACIVDPGYLYTWGAGELLGRILNENGVEIVSTANNKSTKNLKSKVNFPDSCDPINPVFFVKHRVHYLSCGNQHTISRCNTEFYSWGNNSYGQLGLGDTYNCLLPSKVKLPTIKEAEAATSQLVSGGNHMALIVKGKLYTWGCNTSGQIGNNSKEHVSTPTLITIPNISDKGVSFKQVVCGYGYTSVILSNNQLFHWGNMYIPSDNSTVDKVIPKPFSVPEKDFGNTIALASISSTTLSILAIDSEDIVEMKPKTLTIVNSEKPTINPLTSQTIQSISLRKSVNQPTSKLHNQPFYTTKSTKDIERQIYRDNFNSIEITNNLRSTLGIGFRISKIVNKSEKSTSPSTSPGTKKTSIKGKTISCTSIKDSIKDKIGKVKRDAILDYFVTNQSSNKQSNKNNESNLNDFKMSDSDLIISSPIVQLSNKRGVNIPKTEKDILEKFASQRQQSHVKHLNQLVVGSIDDIPISDYDIRASRRISSSPSRFSVYKVNRNTSPDMNSQADKEEKVEIVDESMRSLSSVIDNLRLDIKKIELSSPNNKRKKNLQPTDLSSNANNNNENVNDPDDISYSYKNMRDLNFMINNIKKDNLINISNKWKYK